MKNQTDNGIIQNISSIFRLESIHSQEWWGPGKKIHPYFSGFPYEKIWRTHSRALFEQRFQTWTKHQKTEKFFANSLGDRCTHRSVPSVSYSFYDGPYSLKISLVLCDIIRRKCFFKTNFVFFFVCSRWVSSNVL